MSEKVLRLLASAYLAGYLAFTISGFAQVDLSFPTSESWSVLLLFFFFLTGYIALWFSCATGGILFQVWHLAMWVFSLFSWNDAGGVLLFAFPVLIIGVFLNLSAYNKSGKGERPDDMQWKFVFRLLLVNYSVLYLVLVLSDLLTRNLPDLMTWPYLLLPVLLAVYISGLILSWYNATASGILFVLWYIIILTGTIFFPDFSRNGPYAILGFPLLLQALLYFKQKINHL